MPIPIAAMLAGSGTEVTLKLSTAWKRFGAVGVGIVKGRVMRAPTVWAPVLVGVNAAVMWP